MNKKRILKGSIFTVILISILLSLNWLFIFKTGYRNNLYQGLYANTGDKYDVVFLGSSHMHAAMSPNLLWKDYGITSFNYATAGEPIDVTYYLLKEILKKQEKPVVVVDLYYLGLTEKYGEEGYISYVLDNMKMSKNKVDAILATTPKDERQNYFVPFIRYHNRWKELSKDDIQFNNLDNYFEKGFSVGDEKYGKENKSKVLTEGVGELPPKSEEYLYKMINLSKQQGFKLIFTNVPYDDTSTTGMKNWTQTPEKMFNKVEQICKENNIEFINYNKKYKEIGFDFKSDMFNIGHLNIWGSNKVTNYLGELLKTKYELKDHRNDKSYEKWNTDYLLYLKNHPIAK
ncbi:DUF1574 domain-containing protein [Clostridium estertheticum]|uniref:hypothetical protein n=1 Tax=Clostridium estertheticum TaxID=238834 RepID=UPI0013E928CE|nr:hypothetical protein [Clostridium estertheticum]MBZ9686373.1 DUF1574 domain-containing protein [Clostridium estertheticum]